MSIRKTKAGVAVVGPPAAPPAALAMALSEESLVRVLKALAHPKRLRMVQEIAEGELCCSDLGGCLEAAQPTVSHHLKILCDAGVVTMRREGQFGYAAINHELLDAALGGLPSRIREGRADSEAPRRKRTA